MIRLVVGLLILLALCLSVDAATIEASTFTAGATMINFNNVVGGNCHLCGASITDQYANLGVIFNNPSYPGMDTAQTNLTFGIPGATPPNALYIDQGGHINDPPAIPFEIAFSIPVTMVGFNYASSLDSFLRVDVYGANDTMLDSLTFFGSPTPIGLGGFAGFEESSNITRLEVSYHPNADPNRTFNFSIDNLEFQADPPGPAATSAPEPSSFGLLALIGCIAIPYRFRRRLRRDPDAALSEIHSPH